MESLEGRTALVTGASRGIGEACALALAGAGCAVAVNYREREKEAERVCGAIRAAGGQALPFRADVSRAAGAKTLVEGVQAALGPVAILINNAGVARKRAPLEITEADWDEAITVNLTSAFLVSREVLPGMRERRWGRIINISSIYGREHGGGFSYMTAKAALIAMTKHMALDLAKDGVLANTVAPGSIAFPGGGWDRFQREQPPETVREFIERNLPMGRFGWPEPIGDTVAFLASERASLITGVCINVDGGQSRSLI